MQHGLLEPRRYRGKLAIIVTLAPIIFLMSLDARSLGQAIAVPALASATVIAPVNIQTSLADLPVAVSTFGGWIRVVIPVAHGPSPVSSTLSGGRSTNAAEASPAVKGASLTPENFKQLPSDGTVQGDIVSTLSLRPPEAGVAGGGRYRVTVAFN